METLAIISLVGNVLQFLDFATELISKSVQIYQSGNGAAASVTDTETATQHLRLLATRLQEPSTIVDDIGFGGLCKSCQKVADELLLALAKVKAKNQNSKVESVRKALRTIRNKDELAELERRLAGLRAELNLHITADIRDQVHQFKLEQSAGLESLDSITAKIMDAIESQQDLFSSALQSQRENDVRYAQWFERPGVDETAVCRNVRERCSTPAGRAALVGLGGAGKSQLAIGYSYQLRDLQPQTWVFWVHAGTTARFEEGYRAIAERVKLPDRDKPKIDILRLVYEWLCSEASGSWFLIIDNADDATIFFHNPMPRGAPTTGRKESSSAPALSTYLPQSQNGSILITTRVKDVAFKLAGTYEAIVRVEAMDRDQALALLRIKIGHLSDEAEAGELLEALEYMALAVSQAAAYIRQRAPRSSVPKYLHEFRKSEHRKATLLHHDAGDLRRDPSASNSITITWYMSFDHIRETRPSAAELLSLMSFFDQQDIPEYLVRSSGSSDQGVADIDCQDEESATSCSDSDDDIDDGFEDDVATLRNYSLIGVNKNGNAFKMHSLVQLSTRKWLEDHGQSEKWKAEFISNLSTAFPTAEFGDWGKCQELLAHAEAARKQPPTDGLAMKNWATVLHNAGAYAMAQGKFSVAARMTEKAAATREKALGVVHPSTLTTNCNLALVRMCQGKYEDAEVISRQVLEGRERVLGPHHLDTLTSVNNLGAVLRYQGKYKEAEELNRRVFFARENILGPEHKDTLASLNNLAMILRYQGKYSDSEVFLRKALQGTEKALGKQHPETLRNLSKLATILQKQGKYAESEAMQRQAIEGYTQVLGKDHPDTITGISKLSVVLGDVGKFEEAEAGMRQVLAVRERILGKKHPSSLASAANLASLLQSSGDYPEAGSIGRQALGDQEELLGKEHPDTLTSIHFLAITLQEQGKDDKAELLHLQAFRGREEVIGPEHPDTIASIFSLACLQHKQKRYDDASRLYQRASISYEAILGASHPKTTKCIEKFKTMREERGAMLTEDLVQLPVQKEYLAA